jgi:hypothetical protein
MNVTYNGVQEVPAEAPKPAGENAEQTGDNIKPSDEKEDDKLSHGRRPGCKGKVRVTEGDAWYVGPS